jgi:uncharacterized protein (TIGR03118 family)
MESMHRSIHSVFMPTVAFPVFAAVLACGNAAGQYVVTNLVSDGATPAAFTDPDLVNPWGMAPNPAANGFWWISNEASGNSTLYDGNGNINSLVVTVPPAPSLGGVGTPTGIVFYGGSNFVVTNGVNSAPARFIFATLDGTISGWAPAVPPPPPSIHAFIAVDQSDEGAVYTGLAIASTANGDRLYATDFANGEVDVFDGSFNPVEKAEAFIDPNLPKGYAPFGIHANGSQVFVTYAIPNRTGTEEGPGLGIVNIFDTAGTFVQRFVSNAELNAPWGVVVAPSDFGAFSGDVLVGNFGDGRINAYDATTGAFQGILTDSNGPIELAGLWGLDFGTGGLAGPTNVLFFTAGGVDGTSGLFGRIDVGKEKNDADVDGDGDVDGADLGILLTQWDTVGPEGDLNGDGNVDGADLGIMLAAWTR